MRKLQCELRKRRHDKKARSRSSILQAHWNVNSQWRTRKKQLFRASFFQFVVWKSSFQSNFKLQSSLISWYKWFFVINMTSKFRRSGTLTHDNYMQTTQLHLRWHLSETSDLSASMQSITASGTFSARPSVFHEGPSSRAMRRASSSERAPGLNDTVLSKPELKEWYILKEGYGTWLVQWKRCSKP